MAFVFLLDACRAVVPFRADAGEFAPVRAGVTVFTSL